MIIYGYKVKIEQVTPPIIPTPVTKSLQYTPYRSYHNDSANGKIAELFDSKTTELIKLWSGEFYDPHEVVLNFKQEEEATLSGLSLYDGSGTLSTGNEVQFFYKTFDSNSEVLIGSFNGSLYNKLTNITLPSAKVIRQFIIRKRKNVQTMPLEITLLGTMKDYTPPTTTQSKPKLKELLGINLFVYDIQRTSTDQNAINQANIDILTGYTKIRDFVDWPDLESVEGRYTMANSHPKGWKYENFYAAMKQAGKYILVCIKNTPDYIKNTYPIEARRSDVVPIPYLPEYSTENADGTITYYNSSYRLAKKNPSSYISYGKMYYQFVGRYGNNQAIDISTLSQYTEPRFTNDPINTVKKALGYLDAVEMGNEQNKNWGGLASYQNPDECAAMCSCLYDGHKNTLGVGVGIKNADPNMVVYMNGIASVDPSYIVGMVEWCRENRGYRADGSIDICWDVINYHSYSNNKEGEQYDSSGEPRKGVSVDTSKLDKKVSEFLQVSAEYCGDIPVALTETGWDINPTTQSARVIGTRSVLDVQADWHIQSVIKYASKGLKHLFTYQLKDDDSESTTQYFSCGHFNEEPNYGLSKRIVAWYSEQLLSLFGDYYFTETINENPVVLKFKNSNERELLILWSPTEEDLKTTYSLNLSQDSQLIRFSKTDNVYTTTTLSSGPNVINIDECTTFIKVGAFTESLFIADVQGDDSVSLNKVEAI